jgi:hypothetical protein
MADWWAGTTITTGYNTEVAVGTYSYGAAGGVYATAFGGPANNGAGVYGTISTGVPASPNEGAKSFGLGAGASWTFGLSVGNAEAPSRRFWSGLPMIWLWRGRQARDSYGEACPALDAERMADRALSF